MANLTESSTWEAGIYQLETTDPVIAGADGISNTQAKQLANRTKYLNDNKSPVASPTFTGTPAAPTAAADTNTTQLATTAFVVGQAAETAPVMDGTAAVGTSKRFARQDHVHPTDTSRAPVASPTFTGTPAVPTAAAGNNTTQIANTAFVKSEIERLVGSQIFKVSGTFTVPVGITEIAVTACAGGGGGGGGYLSSYAGEGGGGGDSILKTKYTVTPGASIPITVGSGGSAGAVSTAGGSGGTTIVGSLVTLFGGAGGNPGSSGGSGSSSGAAGGAGACAGEDAFGGVPGNGGGCIIGNGGVKRSSNGTNGLLGGGGAGGYINAAGGAGGAGIVIIEW